MRVRKAGLKDLPFLIKFTAEEAREAEGSIKIPDTLEKGIRAALEDSSIAIYWVNRLEALKLMKKQTLFIRQIN